MERGTSIRVKVSEAYLLMTSDLANTSGFVTEGCAAAFLKQSHEFKEKTPTTCFFNNSLCLGFDFFFFF